ncbi:hypothetical protein C922_03994 [Plasmodium inui San Antonio 1]|uniref:Uncharacterized protein n=1 Tax=Plasmodium inui San Antonio 1 TaxID=1237626 RepID=W7A1D2_9APIC|nr:hypothetical protein C922_03994 [Plasmodium inui San Antonio 1]EUD65490.1 hypothetical protein C922_03994 [Plasmodium inui San Antonio 1]
MENEELSIRDCMCLPLMITIEKISSINSFLLHRILLTLLKLTHQCFAMVRLLATYLFKMKSHVKYFIEYDKIRSKEETMFNNKGMHTLDYVEHSPLWGDGEEDILKKIMDLSSELVCASEGSDVYRLVTIGSVFI